MPDYPVLLGDIGGTNARFALLDGPRATPLALPRGLTAECPDPVAAMRTALAAAPDAAPPKSAFLAIAAPITGSLIRMTNCHWVIDAAAIKAELALADVLLVNDYTPVAAAVAALGAGDVAAVGPDRPAGDGVRIALGPGTGLGVAALVPAGDRLRVLPTEAGHMDFGPDGAEEEAVWACLERVAGRISGETILSGPGLHRLYRALASRRGEEAVLPEASAVQQAGAAGGDALASDTLALFARLLGRFAGDLALAYGAGSVFLASGIAPRIVPTLAAGEFRSAFERKAPHEALMRTIPTFVVTHPEPALFGLALLAADSRRFAFDFHRHA